LARTFEKADASRSVSDDKKSSLTAEKAYGGNAPPPPPPDRRALPRPPLHRSASWNCGAPCASCP